MQQSYDSQPSRNSAVNGPMLPNAASPAPMQPAPSQGGSGVMHKQEGSCDPAAAKNSGSGALASPVRGFTSSGVK